MNMGAVDLRKPDKYACVPKWVARQRQRCSLVHQTRVKHLPWLVGKKGWRKGRFESVIVGTSRVHAVEVERHRCQYIDGFL